MTVKLECNYCDGEFEVVPLNEIEEEQVCFCPYCGNELDDDVEDDDEDEEYEEDEWEN